MASIVSSSPSTSFSSANRTFKSVVCNISSAPRAATVGIAAFVGLAPLTLARPALAAEISLLGSQLTEPANALSLPTWAIHVSSVAEWVIAMALVWQYAEKSGYESWKGLSWGMVSGTSCFCNVGRWSENQACCCF
uniref:Ycf49-like protein n=1 Tax=Kalanchoe fedtschenkoi TaxID=63787 RepID=A0A7N0SYX8_KALFE